MSAFGGARGVGAKPPEKGIFPLDHFGECKKVANAYLACLKVNDKNSGACQDLARRYLECRMERNLMAKQDLRELGFKDEGSAGTSTRDDSSGNGGGSEPSQQHQQLER